jgi:hypothetical protein
MTPTPTNTPSATPSTLCYINTTINVTDTGYIKYTICSTGLTTYVYISNLGSYTITDCIIDGTLSPGYPFGDIASYTLVTSGTPC